MSRMVTSCARRREIFRYYQPAEEETAAGLNPRKSSSDPCLTAFAQLGVLRLKAKRGYITLSTGDPKYSEYIIAEAAPLLSLQKNDDENDKLWHGVGRIQIQTGIGPTLMAYFNGPNPPSHIFVKDITQDERFKRDFAVTRDFKIRSMAVVPLKTVRQGIVFGIYNVVGDTPYSGDLCPEDVEFLTDMATTVSEYLEAERLKAVQHRSERMVKAIGLFIEGKSSLRDWWLEREHKFQQVNVNKSSRDQIPLERRADLEFGVQETVDYFSKHGFRGLQNDHQRSSLPTSPGSSTPSHSETTKSDYQRDGRLQFPTRETVVTSANTTPLAIASPSWQHRNFSATTLDTSTEPGNEANPEPDKQTFVSFDLPPQGSQAEHSHALRTSLLNSKIKGVFSRASNLIREAINVEGIVYFDAAVGSYGSKLNNHSKDENLPDTIPQENSFTTSEEDVGKRSSGDDTFLPERSEQYCKIFGYSTRTHSSLHGHRITDNLQKFPEKLLRKMLKRYPHGKVFNFDENGSISSDSEYTVVPTISRSPRSADNQRRRRLGREAEAATILSVLPGARSVFWFPLWDQHRDRWYSGSLIWSTSPTRTLDPVEDVTYLTAFGNSIMAEISSLSAQVLSKMKTDFISSISHELRSPLHGVLASVEFLQETKMNEVQTDMVNNIHASGKVLLDTINHVLDFSKVNRRSKNKKRLPKRVGKRRGTKDGSDDSVEKADICVLSEEVINTIYAGQQASRKAFSTEKSPNGDQAGPFAVIVNIPYRYNWTFEVDKGAWRRILMNLFSNAMKYTKAGFVKVSLDVEAAPQSQPNKSSRSMLLLRVRDSGRGISQEFLKNYIYKPFTQEDTLSAGAGLGLSIVKAIVQDMGGKIIVESELGTGTEVSVRIPLTQSFLLKKVEERKVVIEVREKCTGLKVRMEGFDRYPDLGEEPTGILSAESEAAIKLRTTIGTRILKDWFRMETITSSDEASPDVVVIMEGGLGQKRIEDILHPFGPARVDEKRVAIVLSNRYQAPEPYSPGQFRVFYLQQPYGPHKMAKLLHQAYCQTSASTLNPATQQTTLSVSCLPPSPALSISPITKYDPNSPPPVPPRPTRRKSQQNKALSPRFGEVVPPLPPSPRIAHHPRSPGFNAGYPSTIKAGLRVLLVEDNDINLRLLVATMRKLKLDHTTAVNGLEALNQYKECSGNFDVIFMDISMPVMSGIESSMHIRKFEEENRLEPVTLIALTGAANENTRQEALHSGIDLFLTKPVPMKALRGMLDDLERDGRAAFAG